MKYYVLKKDLPTFKARQKFEFDENGDLVLRYGDINRVAYSHKELEEFPDILTEWFEQITIGFYLSDCGFVFENPGHDITYRSVYRESIGNNFETMEEAKKHREYLIALQTIKNDAKGFVPDWRDYGQIKYRGYYNHSDSHLKLIDDHRQQNQGAIYFENEEDVKDSFKKHRKEWLIVLGVEND